MNDDSRVTPPEVFSLPVVLCPACDHGIDPHGVDPGGPCGVGGCPCLWSPNDIAATLLERERERLVIEVQRAADVFVAKQDQTTHDCATCRLARETYLMATAHAIRAIGGGA